ncbi:putative large T antigen [Gammapolyomavirus phacarbo]|uniref:Large T antigen n=1 Tax=cormorant polyomavirus 1 TaxID=2896467 RepID=A0A8K1VTC5_9POLY|nr:putative large T antigen [cormorant polyomavirus 1]
MDPKLLEELLNTLKIPRGASHAEVLQNYRRAALAYHPDKGGDEEKMKRLNHLIKLYKEQQCQAEAAEEPDLHAEETLSDSEEEEDTPNDSAYGSSSASFSQQTPTTGTPGAGSPRHGAPDQNYGSPPRSQSRNSSQSFHHTTPPKDRATCELPDPIESCLLNAKSVQSCPDVQVVITTEQKMPYLKPQVLQQFPCHGHSHHSWKAAGLHLLILHLQTATRISTISNFCKKQCTVSPYTVRGVKKNMLRRLLDACQEAGMEVEMSDLDASASAHSDKQFNQALLNEYAIKHSITDSLLLIAIYKRFHVACESCETCKAQKKDMPFRMLKRKWVGGHIDDHIVHNNNAKIFLQLKDQKRVCQAAVDGVLAEKRFRASTMTRNEQFSDRVISIMESVKDILNDSEQTDDLICSIMLLNMLIADVNLLGDIVTTMVKNPPKKRYYIFRGGVNTGKTTVASALLNLMTGASLNINGSPERLQFELGCAIDAFMVLFEDVKGTPSEGSSLQYGMGMTNLDNLRDHLEGAVPVNLERKHQNKIAQIFPPGVITMNDYWIPQTIMARCKQLVTFKKNNTYYRALRANPQITDGRWLTKAETILCLMLLQIPDRFTPDVLKKIETDLGNLQFEFDERWWKYLNKLDEGLSVLGPDDDVPDTTPAPDLNDPDIAEPYARASTSGVSAPGTPPAKKKKKTKHTQETEWDGLNYGPGYWKRFEKGYEGTQK